MYKLSDEELKGLVIEETGAEQDSSVVPLVLACIKQLKKFAKWDGNPPAESDGGKKQGVTPEDARHVEPSTSLRHAGLNLGYTINLNLPATSDPAVFNAIFRALKEHLLRASNE